MSSLQTQNTSNLIMGPASVKELIAKNTVGDLVNLKNITNTLGIKIKLDNELKDLCKIVIEKGSQHPTIYFNSSCDKKTKHTFVAIAISEYVLTPDRVSKSGITYDMFFLSEVYNQKHSYRMLLSTRLAFSEDAILKLKDYNVNSDDFINNSNYLPQFIRCCVTDSSALFLITNFSELDD